LIKLACLCVEFTFLDERVLQNGLWDLERVEQQKNQFQAVEQSDGQCVAEVLAAPLDGWKERGSNQQQQQWHQSQIIPKY
jgi:hypothetical protein